MVLTVKDKTAIVGIGQTEFGKGVAASELELATQAILAALDDAGLNRLDVDGLASYTMETTSEVDLAQNIGFGDISFFGKVGYD